MLHMPCAAHGYVQARKKKGHCDLLTLCSVQKAWCKRRPRCWMDFMYFKGQL